MTRRTLTLICGGLFLLAGASMGGCEFECDTNKSSLERAVDKVENAVDGDHKVEIKLKD